GFNVSTVNCSLVRRRPPLDRNTIDTSARHFHIIEEVEVCGVVDSGGTVLSPTTDLKRPAVIWVRNGGVAGPPYQWPHGIGSQGVCSWREVKIKIDSVITRSQRKCSGLKYRSCTIILS